MAVLVTSKNEEDPIINEGAGVFKHLSHYKSIEIFSNAQGQLTLQSMVSISPNFVPIRDLMTVLVTWKNEGDWIKNVGIRVLTTLNSHFQMLKGR